MVDIVGTLDDPAVFFLHGTPGSRQLYAPFADAGSLLGVCHICCSRFGYEGSDRARGRAVIDHGRDIEVIADKLGIETFYVLGESGGGPHALAVAATLADRVRAVATICSPAPYGAEGLAYFDGMAAENIAEDEAALAGEAALYDFLENECVRIRAAKTWEQLLEVFGELISPADRVTYANGLGDHALEVWQRIASNGIWGWVDDDLALLGDWGFEVGQLTVPVALWHGEDDRIVPFSHGKWLDGQIPTARLRLLPDEGHSSMVKHYGTILDDLLSLAANSGP